MLPQRRKSAEEIAKLREAIGVPGAGPADGEMPEAAEDSEISDLKSQISDPKSSGTGRPTDAAPLTSEIPDLKSQISDLKSDRSKLPSTRRPPRDTAPPAPPVEEDLPPVIPRQPKAVRSLRKSEQGIVEPKPLDPAVSVVRIDAPALPQRRHNDRELMEMRRVQAAAPDQAISHILQLTAPWYFTVLGYLLPLCGALCAWLAAWAPQIPSPEFPTIAMAEFSRKPWLGSLGFGLLAGFSIAGLLLAGWFAWKKPRSRHHAGFIAILAVLILAFGINHQFSPTYGP